MKAGRFDIQLDIHLQGQNGRIDPKYLLQVLESIETSLYASDRKDIEQVAKELRISKVIRDASLERLRLQKDRRMIIVDAKSGSLEIIGLVAGVAYFVLEKTIGEAFSEGFKETGMYEKLKDFFKTKVDEKALYIAENIRRAFASKKREITVKALPPAEDRPNIIEIEVSGKIGEEVELIKSLGEELDKK